MPAKINKVLVFHSSGIGDWLMFSPMLQVLVNHNPHIIIDAFLGTAATQALVKLYPQVSRTYYANANGSKLTLLREIWKTRRLKYDVLLFTAGMDSCKADALAAVPKAEKKIALLHGHHKPRFLTDYKTFDYKKHRLENNLDLGRLLDLEIPKVEKSFFPLTSEIEPELDILFHPGGEVRMAYKRWPVQSYYLICKQLLNRGKKVGVVLGGAEDFLASEFEDLQETPGFHLYRGLSFDFVIEVILKYRLIVTNDTGLGHMAAALDRPTVTMFGPADPVIVRPYHSKAELVVGNEPLDCRPCISPTGRHGCAEAHCMQQIKPDQVIAAIEKMDL